MEVQSKSKTKAMQDADFQRLAEKLRGIGEHLCEKCGRTVTRDVSPPFADCRHDCPAVNILNNADEMEKYMKSEN